MPTVSHAGRNIWSKTREELTANALLCKNAVTVTAGEPIHTRCGTKLQYVYTIWREDVWWCGSCLERVYIPSKEVMK